MVPRFANRTLRRGQFRQERGESYGTPKEIYGFRTERFTGTGREVAQAFLQANTDLFDLEPRLAGLRVQRVVESLGASHVILGQWHDGIRVHRGYVTVHADRAGRVFLSKNRSVPARLLPPAFDARVSTQAALARARRALPKGRRADPHGEPEKVWFPREAKVLPAWKLRLIRNRPRQDWIVYVNARTGGLLSRYDNLSARRSAPARVFDPSPVTRLGRHEELFTARGNLARPPDETYRDVVLTGLGGGPFLTGARVSTQLMGRRRVRRVGGAFRFRAHERGFEEVMVYFHIDASIRYLETLGYRGSHRIFRTPVLANARGTGEDESWYSPSDRTLTFGTGDIDDAEDAETILHELGHAIQDAICPDFGQSPEAAAMGEGFGDYWAASAFESRKPERYRASVMTWDGLLLGLADGVEPPSLRRVDGGWTFDDFDGKGDEHDNGEIWSATLWDVRRELGPETADRVIVESHFQQDGFTTFARGARAILDADWNLESGRHVEALKRIFRRRRIGPLG